MSIVSQSDLSNGLLPRLSRDDFEQLSPHLMPVDLPLRKHLEQPGKAIEHVYFPERGFASVVASATDGSSIEVGLIGHEGMTGIPVLTGASRATNATYIQLKGRGLRISASHLRAALDANASLRKFLTLYVHVFMTQTAQTALANGRNTIAERLARWLLMAHDRSIGDTVELTHSLLSLMLGVRRAGVTVALSELQEKELISATRGAISIRNRKGLEKLAGSAYGTPEAEYARLFK